MFGCFLLGVLALVVVPYLIGLPIVWKMDGLREDRGLQLGPGPIVFLRVGSCVGAGYAVGLSTLASMVLLWIVLWIFYSIGCLIKQVL